jgi:hypothetical protein
MSPVPREFAPCRVRCREVALYHGALLARPVLDMRDLPVGTDSALSGRSPPWGEAVR